MRGVQVGRVFLGLGVVVGLAGGVGLLLGFEPARLPPVLVNIAAYKLTFLASAGLLAGGAIALRYARRQPSGEPSATRAADTVRELREGESPASPIQPRARDHASNRRQGR
jgi:hypothetical protein